MRRLLALLRNCAAVRPLASGLIAATLVLLVRKPQALLLPQFWAEDACVFFREALLLGPSSLLHTYSGYLHLLPRLIALAGTLLPFELVPLFYNLSALAVLLAVAAHFLGSRFEGRHSVWLLLVSVLVFHDGECFLCLTNLQWVVAPYLILFCFRRPPATRIELLLDSLVVVLLGLSGPFVIFCLPFFLIRAIRSRSALLRIWCGVAGLTAAVQLYFLGSRGEQLGGSSFTSFHALFDLLVARFARCFLLPLASADYLGRSFQIGVFAFLLCYLVVLLAGRTEHRFFYGAVLGFAVMETAAALSKLAPIVEALSSFGRGERYFYFSYVLLGWVLVQALADRRKAVARTACLLLALSLGVSLAHFRAPDWPDLDWRGYAKLLRTHDHFIVPVNPPGWGLEVDRTAPDGMWLEALGPGSFRRSAARE